MWTRAALKKQARAALKHNYWRCVAVALVMAAVSGSGGGSGNSGSDEYPDAYFYEEDGDTVSVYYEEENGEDWGATDSMADENTAGSAEESTPAVENSQQSGQSKTQGVLGGYLNLIARTAEENQSVPTRIGTMIGKALIGQESVAVTLVFWTVIFWIVLSICVLNPLEIGGCRFFVKNASESPTLREVCSVFRSGYYGTAVGTLLQRDIFVFLWTLLLIIPGIVKSLEYRMVPYLLAEEPWLSSREAFEKSKSMMDGWKLDVFVLDLSFLGWRLLNVFTLGLLGVFYVEPYRQAANAELYLTLREEEWKNPAEQMFV